HTVELQERVREFSHQVKLMFKEHQEKLVTAQTIQARLSMAVLWLHAMSCSLSKLDRGLRNGLEGEGLDYELAIVDHIFAMGGHGIERHLADLRANTDATMVRAAAAVERRIATLPDGDYAIPERTPDMNARGRGKKINQDAVPQFGSGSVFSGQKVGT